MAHYNPVHVGDAVSVACVNRIYHGLTDKTLPKSHWTHGAHLCAGTAILKDVGLDLAEKTMPDIIRAYNVAQGGQNTDEEGYHHTMTLFYLREIDACLKEWWDFDLGTLATRVLAAPLADKSYPLKFYSKSRLFSVRARKEWIDPDLLKNWRAKT